MQVCAVHVRPDYRQQSGLAGPGELDEPMDDALSIFCWSLRGERAECG